MTREQYEKFKSFIRAEMLAMLARNDGIGAKGCTTVAKEIEKELDKLMFPEGNDE